MIVFFLLVLTPAAHASYILDAADWFVNLFISIPDYEPIIKSTLTGYQDIYKEEQRTKFMTCDILNTSCTPYTLYYNISVFDHKEPVYKEEVIGLKYSNGYTTDFNTKICNVCGDLEICWSKKDGASVYRADSHKCICRSGESCYIRNIKNSKITYERSDIGEI